MEEITGVWVSPIQYRMTNARTSTVRMLFLPQAPMMEQAEIADLVGEGEEMFRDYLASKATHQAMPKSQQHEFGPHLRAIETSKRRARQVGHGRYWLGGKK